MFWGEGGFITARESCIPQSLSPCAGLCCGLGVRQRQHQSLSCCGRASFHSHSASWAVSVCPRLAFPDRSPSLTCGTDPRPLPAAFPVPVHRLRCWCQVPPPWLWSSPAAASPALLPQGLCQRQEEAGGAAGTRGTREGGPVTPRAPRWSCGCGAGGACPAATFPSACSECAWEFLSE